MSASSILDLTLDADANGYRLRMHFVPPDGSAARDAETSVAFNFTALRALELDALAYGQALYGQLFTDRETEMFFRECRAATGAAPLRLRVCLRAEAQDLHRLRWETLRDGKGEALTAGDRLWLSRYLFSDQARPTALRPRADLRALVTIANPTGSQLAPVNVTAERERATSTLGALVQTVLDGDTGPRATLENLLRHVRECDVLYLACHGAFNKDESESAIWLEDEAGAAHRVTGEELIGRLREFQLPRLIVLLSCQSARSDVPRVLLSLGPRLSALGVPAVLAMQGEVSMETGARFMPEFFRALAKDGQIDQAFAAARSAIHGQADAWMPVLFLRSENGRLWVEPTEPTQVSQTTIAGDASGAVLSGQFAGPVNITIQQGLNSLASLIENNPEARETLGKYRVVVEIVGNQIQELGDYKSLHDGLHEVQFKCYDMVVGLTPGELKRPATRRMVEDGLRVLGEVITDAQTRAARLPRKEREIEWVSLIVKTQTLLRAALPPTLDAEALEDAKDTLLRLLNRAPGRIDKALLARAENLRLKDLIRALDETLPALRQLPATAFKADDFNHSLNELRGFDERLTALCYAHTDWQELIDGVRDVESGLKEDDGELARRWAGLRADTDKLCQVAPPLATLLDNAEMVPDLLTQCAVVDTAATSTDAETARYEFEEYRRRVNLLFKRLDDNLKMACDKLVAAATEPLTKLANRLMG